MLSTTPQRRGAARTIVLDRSLEALPLFRLSDSAEEGAITYTPDGGRWRVLPVPGDRLPGTFDQDVYVELLHRYTEAGTQDDADLTDPGAIRFTLHAFLRSIGRRADGRTYDQLRSALSRLHRTTIESFGAYYNATTRTQFEGRMSILSSVVIERRRHTDREQLPLFSTVSASEPGDARVVLSPLIRANIAAGHTVTLLPLLYQSLSSPVARRLYRLLAASTAHLLGVQSTGTDTPSDAPIGETAQDSVRDTARDTVRDTVREEPATASQIGHRTGQTARPGSLRQVASHRAQSGEGGVSEETQQEIQQVQQVQHQTRGVTWQVGLEQLAAQLPLAQRYPSHLQRVLQPAHEMLLSAGILKAVRFDLSDRHIIYSL